jgi:hypothetical protein
MKMSKTVSIAIFIVGLGSASIAEAGCNTLSGTFAGSGAGQVKFPDPSGKTGASIKFVNFSYSLSLSPGSNGISGTINAFGKTSTIPLPEYQATAQTPSSQLLEPTGNWSSSSTAIISSSGPINPFSTTTSSSPGQVNVLNTNTCVGIITASLTINNTGDPLPVTYVITVTNSGQTITLSDFTQSENLPAFTIELRKI